MRRISIAFQIAALVTGTTLVMGLATTLYEANASREQILSSARQTTNFVIQQQAQVMQRALDEMQNDLAFVSSAPAMRALLPTLDAQVAFSPDTRRTLTTLIADTITRTPNRYNRACLLNASGLEVLCVDLVGNQPVVPAGGQLVSRASSVEYSALVAQANTADATMVPVQIYDTTRRVGADATAIPVLRYDALLKNSQNNIVLIVALEARADSLFTSLGLDKNGDYTVSIPGQDQPIFKSPPITGSTFTATALLHFGAANWTLAYTVPADVIYRSVDDAVQPRLLFIMAVTLISLLFSLRLSSAIASPILKLAAATRNAALADDNRLILPSIGGSRELDQLAQDFKRYSASLQNAETRARRIASITTRLSQSTDYASLLNTMAEMHTPPPDHALLWTQDEKAGLQLAVGDDTVARRPPDGLRATHVMTAQTDHTWRSAIPLHQNNRLIGVMDFVWDTEPPLDPDLAFIYDATRGTAAAQIAERTALDEVSAARSDAALRARNMSIIAGIAANSVGLGSNASTTDVLREITTTANLAFNLDIAPYLLDPEGQMLLLIGARDGTGPLPIVHPRIIHLNTKEPLATAAVSSNRIVTRHEVLPDDDQSGDELIAPLMLGDHLMGIVRFVTLTRIFTEHDKTTLNLLTGLIAVTYENARLYEKAKADANAIREMSDLKTEFLSTMSHELRTPLNIILGYAELTIADLGLGQIAPDRIDYKGISPYLQVDWSDDKEPMTDLETEQAANLLKRLSDRVADRQHPALGDVRALLAMFGVSPDDLSNRTIQMRNAGLDLLGLVNRVLDVSKIEEGVIEIHEESVRVSDMLDEIEAKAQALSQRLQRQTVRYLSLIEPQVPEVVITDLEKLNRILGNLLSNAYKFTEQGEIALIVSSPNNGQLVFELTDTGIGIREADQIAVFEKFRQVESGTRRAYGGTGLGLFISRNLAQLLGGSLTMTSRYGEGTTFTLTLPLVLRKHTI